MRDSDTSSVSICFIASLFADTHEACFAFYFPSFVILIQWRRTFVISVEDAIVERLSFRRGITFFSRRGRKTGENRGG